MVEGGGGVVKFWDCLKPGLWMGGVKLIGILINQYFGVGVSVAGAQNFEAMKKNSLRDWEKLFVTK